MKGLIILKNILKRLEMLMSRHRSILSENEIYYIGGSDILPAPLTKEEEDEIILKLPDDEDAKSILIERNLRLVVYIARKFENTGVYVEDLISIGTIGLIKAINTFNPNKNIKLATYASRCIENEISIKKMRGFHRRTFKC